MMDREHGMLFLESNYDQNGKCLDIDEDGQDVPAGKLSHCPIAA
jgi:hypothetical protein